MLVVALYVVVRLLRLEPYRANVFILIKLYLVVIKLKNKYLEKVLRSKGLKGEELESIWKDIVSNEGSVQDLDILTD